MLKILKEPLLHFLLIGAAFFLLYSWVGETESDGNVIRIDESDLEEVVSKFEMQWNRVPTEEELLGIIEKRVEEEIFYQEALKMNLDHNDEIIKRRLSQKMQFLSNDISNIAEPTEAQLQEYYKLHIDQYMTEAVYSIHQVFFSPDMRDNWRKDAQSNVKLMNQVSVEEALKMGDPIALPQTFTETTAFHISRQMGDEFLNGIAELDTGFWQGPISSGYGAHVVFINSIEKAKPADYESVKEKVSKDFTYENQSKTKEALFQEFKKKYEIDFDVKSEQFTKAFVKRMEAEISGE